MALVYAVEDSASIRESVVAYLRLEDHEVREFEQAAGVSEAHRIRPADEERSLSLGCSVVLEVAGEIAAGTRYDETDFYRAIEIREREAHRVQVFMEQIDQHEKSKFRGHGRRYRRSSMLALSLTRRGAARVSCAVGRRRGCGWTSAVGPATTSTL
jgi:hypothetical protein